MAVDLGCVVQCWRLGSGGTGKGRREGRPGSSGRRVGGSSCYLPRKEGLVSVLNKSLANATSNSKKGRRKLVLSNQWTGWSSTRLVATEEDTRN